MRSGEGDGLLRGGQMVSEEGRWSQRRADGLRGGQMVSEEGDGL